MIPKSIWIPGVALALSVLAGCSSEPMSELIDAEEFTLYSILSGPPLPPPAKPVPTTGEAFHGWQVMGKLEIRDAARKKAIIEALHRALDESSGSMAACFNPRHAIRVRRFGLAIDYLICFECGRIRRYRLLVLQEDLPVRGTAQKILNLYLRGAGIALDPAMKGNT